MMNRKKIVAFGMTALMVLGALLVMTPAGAVSGRQNNWIEPWSISPSIFYPGDRAVSFSITIHNTRTGSPHDIINATLFVTGVEGSFNPFEEREYDSPNINNVSGYGTPSLFTGLSLNVKDSVTIGKYILTFVVRYQYRLTGDPNIYTEQEEKHFTVEVRSLITLGTQILHYRDDNSYPPSTFSTLYAGETFQRMGVSANAGGAYYSRSVQGNVMTAQLRERSGMTGEYYQGFNWNGKTSATIQNMTQWTNFIYRLSVDAAKKAGRYDYDIELAYTREDSLTGGATAVIKETSTVSLFVDFTPLLDISNGGKVALTQGVTSQFFNVTFKNSGNCDLAKLYIWLDISNWFEYHGGYYYDGNSAKGFSGIEQYLETLPRGSEQTVQFNLDVFQYLPAGEHRLEVMYEGYYYDDGSFKYTDYKWTSQATYNSIKGKELYVQVDVVDLVADVTAELQDSVSLGGRVKDVSLSVLVTNKEAVQFDEVMLLLSCGPRNGTTPVFVNARLPASKTLDAVKLLALGATSSEWVTFKADMATNVLPGFYDLDLTVTGVNHNSKGVVTKTIPMSVRVNPAPAKFTVGSQYDQKLIKAGKFFDLTLQLTNTGLDLAREVFVTFDDQTGDKPQSYIVSGDRVSAYEIDGLLNPFTVNSSRVYIGEIQPGATSSYRYEVHADKNLAKGRSYEMTVTVAFRDSFGAQWTQTTEVALKAYGDSPARPAPDPYLHPMVYGPIMMILVWLFVLMGYLIVKKINRPRTPRYGEMTAMAPEQVPVAPAAPVQAPPQYQPPPPPPPPIAQPAQMPAKVCRKCGLTVDHRENNCPRCGNPMR